jgi:hypothetical protein
VKPFAIALKWGRKGLWKRDGGGYLTNVQYNPISNCHTQSSLNNKHILIKMKEKKEKKTT